MQYFPPVGLGPCSAEGCDRRCNASLGLCGVHRAILCNYKLDPTQYAELVEAQGGVCAICGETHEDGSRLHIDHDHSCCPGPITCGLCIRGLLCRKCNIGLATVERMGFEAIAAYLIDPPFHSI
jgi:Recombination endonuclease VII